MVFLFWIIFDTAIGVRMAFVSPEHGIPIWECVAWGLGGLAIGLWAFLSERSERKAHNAEVRDLNNQLVDLKTGQTFQSGQLNAIAGLLGPEIAEKLAVALSENLTQALELVGQAVGTELSVKFEEQKRNFAELKSLIAKPEPAEQRLQEINQRIESWQPTLTANYTTPQALAYAQLQARNQAMGRRRMQIFAAAGAWVDKQKQLKKDDPEDGSSN